MKATQGETTVGEELSGAKPWSTPEVEDFDSRPQAAFNPFFFDDTTLRSS